MCFATVVMAQQEPAMVIMKLDNQKYTLKTMEKKEAASKFSGEIIYRIVPKGNQMIFELDSFSMIGSGIKTKEGDTGNISMTLKPQSAVTKYDPVKNIIVSDFLVDVHYPLIDRIKGYIQPKEGEREKDDYRSYTETFAVTLSSTLSEKPRIDQERMLKKGTGISMKIELKEKEKGLGRIYQFMGTYKIDKVFIAKFYLKKVINIRPVFVRYTPATGCFGGSTTATTGGSFITLRDKAIEMWGRCCISLNFLPVAYVTNDNYRILSTSEDSSLMAAYDDPNAVEVYFAEVGDPLGTYGGGVCYSGGTANTKIITYDTNLPINLYNLAHELGHALGLSHPPGNSTSGSLMEPSGFCADNPALMSKQNCDNASNPLLSTAIPLTLCIRNTNMP